MVPFISLVPFNMQFGLLTERAVDALNLRVQQSRTASSEHAPRLPVVRRARRSRKHVTGGRMTDKCMKSGRVIGGRGPASPAQPPAVTHCVRLRRAASISQALRPSVTHRVHQLRASKYPDRRTSEGRERDRWTRGRVCHRRTLHAWSAWDTLKLFEMYA